MRFAFKFYALIYDLGVLMHLIKLELEIRIHFVMYFVFIPFLPLPFSHLSLYHVIITLVGNDAIL